MLDGIRNGLNWAIGGLTPYGQEGFVVRGALDTLKGSRPYAADALAKMDELAAGGFDMDSELPQVMEVYMNGLVEHMQTLPPEERFGEFKYALSQISGGQADGVLNAFDAAGQGVKDALVYAVSENPNFVDYLSNPESTGSLGGVLNANVLQNPEFAGPIADILTTIGNNPDYDFAKLDALGGAAEAYFAEEALTGENRSEERLSARRRELLNAVREAGGNFPAIANLDMNMMMQFLNDLFNGDIETAIGNLANGLGLQGEELENFTELVQPIAGVLKFMGQDYYDYGVHYAPQAMAYGTKGWNTIDGMMNGTRVQQTNGVTTVASADGTTIIEGPDGRDINVEDMLNLAETLSPHDAEALRAQVETGDMSGLARFVETIAPHSADSITVSERTASLSGSGLTTEVASLTSSTFNPNSSGERTDGYTPDTPAGPDAGRSYTYKVGGLDAALT